MPFTGQSVENVTKVRQSDIFKKVIGTVVGTVSVPITITDAGEALPMATLLNTTDGGLTWTTLTTPAYVAGTYQINDEVYFEGHIFKSTAADNTAALSDASWTDLGVWNANGVLYNDLTASQKTTVVVTGEVTKKYLAGFDEFLRTVLFENKILVK